MKATLFAIKHIQAILAEETLGTIHDEASFFEASFFQYDCSLMDTHASLKHFAVLLIQGNET